MCAVIVRPESRWIPRSRTVEDGVIALLPTLNRSCRAVNCLQLEDSHSTCVLAGFSWNLSERIHIDTSQSKPVLRVHFAVAGSQSFDTSMFHHRHLSSFPYKHLLHCAILHCIKVLLLIIIMRFWINWVRYIDSRYDHIWLYLGNNKKIPCIGWAKSGKCLKLSNLCILNDVWRHWVCKVVSFAADNKS